MHRRTEEADAFTDNVRKRIAKCLKSKAWRSVLPYQGQSLRTIKCVTRGWHTNKEIEAAEPPTKQPRFPRACNKPGSSRVCVVKEAPDRAEYRREKFEAVCYLGEADASKIEIPNEAATQEKVRCSDTSIQCAVQEHARVHGRPRYSVHAPYATHRELPQA